MIVFFSIINSIGCLIKKNSKFFFFSMLILLWIICSFTTGNADESLYISRYNEYLNWAGKTELIYFYFIVFLNKLHIPYIGFKMISSFIEISLIGYTVFKHSKSPNIVLVLYFIFPFMIDVAQMRNALATAVMIFGSGFILNNIESEHKSNKINMNDIKFVICILIATFIHTASLIWIILLIAEKLNIKKTIFFTIAFIILFQIFFSPNIVKKIASIFGAESRIAAYVNVEYQATKIKNVHNAMARVLMSGFLILAFCLYFIIIKKNKSPFLNYCLRMNIIILCIIPIILSYTTEVYRMQQGIALITYICFSNLYDFLNTKNNIEITCSMLIYSSVNLYILIIRMLLHPVFLPIFCNNSLINGIIK